MMADHPLDVTPDRVAALSSLRDVPKFRAEPQLFYSGAPTEEIRTECEAALNHLLERLPDILEADPRIAVALDEFRKTLACFKGHDSEERNRICTYLEEIMDILGIESSDGLLNTWRYGFDPCAGTGRF